ncbi:MAG TPA: SDR family NAD(P)-dependent oxidoreductase [Polyangiaceae bacterium]
MGTFDWKSQVVVVTGASAGIGASLAREVGKRGGEVVLAARREDKLAEEVATLIADLLEQRRGGDVYSRPEFIDRVLGYLRGRVAGA